MSETLTLQPTTPDNKGNLLSRENPSSNYGSNVVLQAGTDNTVLGDTVTRFLIAFDLSTIPTYSEIESATITLKMTGAGARPDPTTFYVNRVTQAWTHAGSTWSTYNGTNAWTTAGGDYTATGQVSVSVGAPVSGGTLTIDVADLVEDAVQNRSGQLNLIVRGPEDVGYDAFVVVHSGHATTPSNRPKIEVVYTEFPVVERIARCLKSRLETVTTGAGYTLTFNVVRPLREGVKDFSHGLCVLEQAAEAARDDANGFPGNPPAVCWDQDFTVTLYISPDDATTPVDTIANLAAADAELAITDDTAEDWAQMDGLAVLTEQTGRDIFADGDSRQIRLTYRVKYRTSENDPYTVR